MHRPSFLHVPILKCNYLHSNIFICFWVRSTQLHQSLASQISLSTHYFITTFLWWIVCLMVFFFFFSFLANAFWSLMGQEGPINTYTQPEKMSHVWSNPTRKIPFLYSSVWQTMTEIWPIQCKRKSCGERQRWGSLPSLNEKQAQKRKCSFCVHHLSCCLGNFYKDLMLHIEGTTGQAPNIKERGEMFSLWLICVRLVTQSCPTVKLWTVT